ncbi:GGDEF domain-containing protein [Marinisporobacter balticus]|nr:GGDEF domain-containing protein [Marinisporobacter balticus]
MFLFYKNYFQTVSMQDQQEFSQQKFVHNNFRILFLAVFLTIEQAYYGFFVRENGSLIQKIHLLTALVMLTYAMASLYIQKRKPVCSARIFQIYEVSFGFYGFFIAAMRVLLIQNDMFRLPTIFIAVFYGFAVIFYFNPFESFIVYSVTSVSVILFLPIFQPTLTVSSYVEDTVANAMIAWIASFINYYKYVKEFINQKIIETNNQELKAKTEQIQKMNEKLTEFSIKDGLTNIYNRRKLNEVLKYEYNRAKNDNKGLSVMLLDLDRFKSVNDTYGHNVGDKVLIEIADLLKRNVRNRDTVGRWGGEEFLIICPETNINQALDLSEKLRKRIEKHKFQEINCRTSSFGVSIYKKGDAIEDIIKRADEGLYKAKENGRNRVEISI